MPSRQGYEREENSPQPKVLELEHTLHSDISTLQGVTEFQISPTRLIRQLLCIVGVLVLLSTLGQISRHVYHRNSLFGLVDLFYVDTEGNIPTAYSSFAWLLCSLASAVISIAKKQTGDRFAAYWRGIAWVFAYIALDEVAVIHELLVQLRSVFPLTGAFYFAWIIPGMMAFLTFALICLKFVKTLPTKTRILLIASGGIFVTGAIGMEMIGGAYTEAFGYNADLTYVFLTTVEETLEMIAVLVLLYALLSYMSSHVPPLKVKVLSK
jgi:hypothetical protein